jgi:hypothetical protein
MTSMSAKHDRKCYHRLGQPYVGAMLILSASVAILLVLAVLLWT